MRATPASSGTVQWCSTRNSVRPISSNPAPLSTAASGGSRRGLVPVGGDAVAAAERLRPPAQQPAEGDLPVERSGLGARRPAQREEAARLQPAANPARDQVPGKPVEGVADDGDREMRGRRVQFLHARDDRHDARPHRRRKRPSHAPPRPCPAPGQPPRLKRTRRRSANASCPVPQARSSSRPRPGRPRLAHQVGDQRVRVRELEPVVVLGRAPVEVGRVRRFVAHDCQHSTGGRSA